MSSSSKNPDNILFDPSSLGGEFEDVLKKGLHNELDSESLKLLFSLYEKYKENKEKNKLNSDGFSDEFNLINAIFHSAIMQLKIFDKKQTKPIGVAARSERPNYLSKSDEEREIKNKETEVDACATSNKSTNTVSKPTIKKPLTALDIRLIDASAKISSSPPRGDEMAFTHAVLCQVGLPRSKVNGDSFLRQSGSAWVNVQSGYLDEGNGPIQQPIPYGAMPRLALAWVSTYAKRNNTREVPIGNSAKEFLELLDQPTTGGPRGTYTTLRQQMHALAACRLQLGYKGRTYSGQPVEQFDAWVINKNFQQKALWPGVIMLSDGYFKELITNGVPLDNRALIALKGSALALDVYTWLAHRLYRIDGRPVILHWKSLRDQFGQEYQGKEPDKSFKKEFLLALKKALIVYPKANVTQVTGGLLLKSSPPPIRK